MTTSTTEILTSALRAPSAHNAQPWRLSQVDDATFDVVYAYADRLLADPDDRDGLMAAGAFVENLSLAAQAAGRRVDFTDDDVEVEEGRRIGRIRLAPLDGEPDRLAAHVSGRITNRNAYDRIPLPPLLRAELADLGAAFLVSDEVAPLVRKASVMAWKDRRFIEDLTEWTRFDGEAEDGLTCDCLELSWVDRQALRAALAAGRLTTPIAHAYATRDVRLTKASSAVVVLGVDERTTASLVDCGRRLFRSWVTITSAGWSYHPISIVIDQPTAAEVPALSGLADPVAIFRVGLSHGEPTRSNRRPLGRILLRNG